MSVKPRPVHDDGAVLLRKFKTRTRKQEKVERSGKNNKFDPNKVGDGFLHTVTVDKDTLLAERAAAVRNDKPADDIEVKPWYMLSFDEVIELHSKKKPPKKKEVVPHPAFGVSSKPRFELTPSSSSSAKKNKIVDQTKSPSKAGTAAAVDEAVAEEEIVKSRRLRVSDLESEIAAIDRQIQKVEGDSQRYTSQMQRIMAAAEKSDADLVILKQNAVRTLSNARNVVNKVIQKNRQHDSLKRTLVQDIKKWENSTRKALNPYAQKDFERMSEIVEKDRARRMIRFRIRVALFKFAARVMHKDPAKRSKWRQMYTLGAVVKDKTRGSPSTSGKGKAGKTLSVSQSADDMGLRKSSVLSTTALFKPQLSSGAHSSVVSSAQSTDSNNTSFTLLAQAAVNKSAATAASSSFVAAPSLATTLRPSMISTTPVSPSSALKRASSAGAAVASAGGSAASVGRTSSVTFSSATKSPPPPPPLQRDTSGIGTSVGAAAKTPPPPPPPQRTISSSSNSSNSTNTGGGGSPRSGQTGSILSVSPTAAATPAVPRTGSVVSVSGSKDEIRGTKKIRGSFSQLFGAVG